MIKISAYCLWTLCWFSFPVAAATLLDGLPDAAVINAAESAFDLYPGVVVDPDGEVVYLMSPEGGIEKISVASGEVIWSTTEAAKPLALYGDLLIAQADRADGADAGALEIVLLDTRAGGQRRADLPINLPSDVRAGVDEELGYSFQARATIVGGEPLVAWKQTKSYAGGAAPPPDQPLYQKQDAGYRLDFLTGQALALGNADIDAARLLPANVQTWQSSNDVVIPPLRSAGGVLAATQEHRQGDSKSITLKRWDATSGAALPDVELFKGPYIVQFASADGHHLLVAERAHPGEFNEYDWSFFSLETGEKSGQVSHFRSNARFHVSGDILLFVQPPQAERQGQEWVQAPLQIKAIYLSSGNILWQRPLRDTTYYGPYPP